MGVFSHNSRSSHEAYCGRDCTFLTPRLISLTESPNLKSCIDAVVSRLFLTRSPCDCVSGYDTAVAGFDVSLSSVLASRLRSLRKISENAGAVSVPLP